MSSKVNDVLWSTPPKRADDLPRFKKSDIIVKSEEIDHEEELKKVREERKLSWRIVPDRSPDEENPLVKNSSLKLKLLDVI